MNCYCQGLFLGSEPQILLHFIHLFMEHFIIRFQYILSRLFINLGIIQSRELGIKAERVKRRGGDVECKMESQYGINHSL